MVTVDMKDKVIDIEDLGVTMRTLLAVAATGYAKTDRRKWGIRYKNVVIGNVQVASLKPEYPQASPVIAELDKNIVTSNVQVASNFRPGSLQASLVLSGLV